MIVNEQISYVPEYDPLRHFHFGDIPDDNKITQDVILWVGSQGACNVDPSRINLFYDAEQPNMWFHEDSLENAILNETRHNKIFSVCPYTSAWRNKILNRKQYIVMPYYMHSKYIPSRFEKNIDIIYTGNICKLSSFINEVIVPFNHKIISSQPDIDYKAKLNFTAQSKISFIHNQIAFFPDAKETVKTIDRYSENEIFKDIDSTELLPQLKTRTFEAAFSKSLILCLKDNYNVIERYFEPEEDFIYLDDNRAQNHIQNILDNYGDYIPMVEKVFEKVMDLYTTPNFLKLIQQELS
jgi:hypothetical protein